jgi:hypothetical protein
MKNCLSVLHQKVFDPFLKDKCPSEDAVEEDGLGFFPSLPMIRRRGMFVADKQGSKQREDFCTKFSKGHPSLLPGVFTVFCPHGKKRSIKNVSYLFLSLILAPSLSLLLG